MENGSRKGTAQGRVGFSANKSRSGCVRMEIGNGEWKVAGREPPKGQCASDRVEIGNGEWRLEEDRSKGSVRVSGDREWRMEAGREPPKQGDLPE